ncbi:uncharacterized protein LOC128215154 [Mya arenaria]|uniref:uncharacterized protein LOC128215154 n=1 Tax=Mya arenaria TaxID=6604 RepID=UPI0022E1E4BE|nr:uncharacterized protein LOC128215154 [Mya arenaria]
MLGALVRADNDDLSDVQDSGTHCGNITIPVEHGSEETDAAAGEQYRCVPCMFSNNCLKNNTCAPGTTGSTCEKCLVTDGAVFYRLGNTCIPCAQFPWRLVSFGIFLIVCIIAAFCNGFTPSVSTKIKLLIQVLQYLVLTLHIKILWPEKILQVIEVIDFGFFSSYLLTPECIFPRWSLVLKYYTEWLSSIGVPVVIFIVFVLVDKKLRWKTTTHAGPSPDTIVATGDRRTVERRFFFLVAMATYAPITLSAIRTYLCSTTVPKELVLDPTQNVFLLDNDISCDKFVFQTIHFVASLVLFVVGVLMPILIVFFTLRQRKWGLLNSQWKKYGPIYEPYKNRFCFWQAFPMIRTLVAIVITETYPFPAFLQTTVQFGMTGFYLILLLVLRPYRPCYWVHPSVNIHAVFEIMCTVVLLLVQGVAFSMVMGHTLPHSDIATIGCVTLLMVVWLIVMATVPLEAEQEIPVEHDGDEGESIERKTASQKGKRKLKFWKKKQVGPDPAFLEKIEANKDRINF